MLSLSRTATKMTIRCGTHDCDHDYINAYSLPASNLGEWTANVVWAFVFYISRYALEDWLDAVNSSLPHSSDVCQCKEYKIIVVNKRKIH